VQQSCEQCDGVELAWQRLTDHGSDRWASKTFRGTVSISNDAAASASERRRKKERTRRAQCAGRKSSQRRTRRRRRAQRRRRANSRAQRSSNTLHGATSAIIRLQRAPQASTLDPRRRALAAVVRGLKQDERSLRGRRQKKSKNQVICTIQIAYDDLGQRSKVRSTTCVCGARTANALLESLRACPAAERATASAARR
jgi:hypothetical protein